MEWITRVVGWMRGRGSENRSPVRHATRPEVEGAEQRLLLSGAVEVVTPPLLPGPPAVVAATVAAVEMTATPDGSVWLSMFNPNPLSQEVIDRIKPDGTITPYKVPGLGWVSGLAPGPDGDPWFTFSSLIGPGFVGKINADGRVTEFQVRSPDPTRSDIPERIIAGPDGNLWFTDYDGSLLPHGPEEIVRVTPTGAMTVFPVPFPVDPQINSTLAVGPDHNIWFAAGNSIVRLTPAGAFTRFPLGQATASRVANGLPGTVAIVFDTGQPLVGAISASGQISTYAIPRQDQAVFRNPEFEQEPVVADGSLWFINSGKIGRIPAAGRVLQYNLSPFIHSLHNEMNTLTAAPDGSIYFFDWSTAQVDRLFPQLLPGRPYLARHG